jgi:hypothetical protein
MSILEMLFDIAWTNLDLPFSSCLSHFLIDISILSCFLQWANLLDFILGMSYGGMCCLLELGIMTEGVGCLCIRNYSIHRTEHSSTSCKCLSCAHILEHKKKKDPCNFSGIWDVWYIRKWNLINSGVSSMMPLCRSQIQLFSGWSHESFSLSLNRECWK